jgi:hypothetical protein
MRLLPATTEINITPSPTAINRGAEIPRAAANRNAATSVSNP